MAEAAACEDTTLHLTRTFAAPRERVFRAWTDPEALKRWWLPAEGFSVSHAEVDLRPGGRYRVTMQSAAGAQSVLVGTYREVRPPERLVYTWQWEQQVNVGETLVTVDFIERGEGTEVSITHTLFADRAARDRHVSGWSGCLDHLPAILA